MSKCYFTRTLNGFEAFDDDCRETLKRFKIGEVHQIELKKKRNHRFLAKYHVLVNRVIFPNQDFFKTKRELKEFIRLETGCFDTIVLPDGSKHRKTISPSFDNVPDDIKFDSDYFQPTIQAGLMLVVGATEEELRKRTDEILRFAS